MNRRKTDRQYCKNANERQGTPQNKAQVHLHSLCHTWLELKYTLNQQAYVSRQESRESINQNQTHQEKVGGLIKQEGGGRDHSIHSTSLNGILNKQVKLQKQMGDALQL